MKADGQGRGKIVPTGKSEPKIDVEYDISHSHIKTDAPSGQMTECRFLVVHQIVSVNGDQLPWGDCDLLIGDEIARLRRESF